MSTIDIPTLVNWLVTGFIGFAFGVASAWVTYRYQRKRDDIEWGREKEKRKQDWEQEQERMRQEWEHERETLVLQSQQRLKEFEQQWVEQEQTRIRTELLKGVGDPKALRDQEEMKRRLDLLNRYLQSGKGDDIFRTLQHTYFKDLDEVVRRHIATLFSEEWSSLQKLLKEVNGNIERLQQERAGLQDKLNEYVKAKVQ